MSTAAVSNSCGDSLEQELEDIYRQYYQLVYRTAYTITGTRQDAEEVLQTVFLKLLQRDVPQGLRENPKPYLYRAAVNHALNAVRSRKRQRLDEGASSLEAIAPEPSRDRGDDIQEHLVKAMASLHPQAVEILVLRYEHDYSDAEIAEMLGKSRGTVAVTLYRARTRLKRLLRSTLGEHQ
jgi:RNA polymerase sigma-70 factor (ECF subfamily)